MNLHIVVRPQAQVELLAARDWYEARRPGLGLEFVGEVGVVIESIREHPLMHRRVHGETRRAVLRRFPYAVYFRVLAEEIVVLGVVHGHRDPSTWKSRRP